MKGTTQQQGNNTAFMACFPEVCGGWPWRRGCRIWLNFGLLQQGISSEQEYMQLWLTGKVPRPAAVSPRQRGKGEWRIWALGCTEENSAELVHLAWAQYNRICCVEKATGCPSNSFACCNTNGLCDEGNCREVGGIVLPSLIERMMVGWSRARALGLGLGPHF